MGKYIDSKGAKIKVLFAIKAMDDASGGAERVLAQVASGFAERGHEVRILTFDQPGGNSFYPLHAYIRRITLGIGRPLEKATLGETLRRIPAMRKVVKAEEPDIVIAFMHSMFLPMAYALIGTGIPLIASEHIVPAHYKTRPLEFMLFRLTAPLLRRITTVSENAKKLYPAGLRRKMIAVPNPLALPKNGSQANVTESKIILNVGRLSPQKNQAVLIDAFARISDRFPDWRVRIIGEGSLRPQLQDQIDRLGLTDRVTLVGHTRDIDSEYQKAALFALPSTYESFGLATAEAMGHSLPAIGYADCPGTNELIAHGKNGLLVERTEEVSNFAAALEAFMADPVKRQTFGAAARQSVKKFDTAAVLDSWEALLSQHLSDD